MLYANRLDIYTKGNNFMIKGVYFMECLGTDEKKLVFKVIVDHVVNDTNSNGNIGI